MLDRKLLGSDRTGSQITAEKDSDRKRYVDCEEQTVLTIRMQSRSDF